MLWVDMRRLNDYIARALWTIAENTNTAANSDEGSRVDTTALSEALIGKRGLREALAREGATCPTCVTTLLVFLSANIYSIRDLLHSCHIRALLMICTWPKKIK